MLCDRARQNIVLMLYGELEEKERLEVDRHLEGCRACHVALAEERRLQAILTGRPAPGPSAALLARCREDLSHWSYPRGPRRRQHRP